MEVKDLEYRMYGLVPYNISPIQQGIQYGHAVQEYNNQIDKLKTETLVSNSYTKEVQDIIIPFHKWANEDKTFIILNGGTTNNKGDHRLGHGGSLNQHLFKLNDMGVKIATFYEPDLGNQLTAVVFLVDERVFNKEKYPDRFLGGSPEPNPDGSVNNVYLLPESEEAFEERLGGKTNVWLREFLKQFRLA